VDALASQARESNLSEAMMTNIASNGRNVEDALIEDDGMEKSPDCRQAAVWQQRLCLELRAESLRYQDIAEVLQIRTSTVGEILRRAIQHLRKCSQ
jgi:DNA-directed RNA polymerase specialized sigma24 family protein